MCEDTKLRSTRPRNPTMNIAQDSSCLSTDLQVRINPPSIPIIKAEIKEKRASSIIKVKM